MPANVPPGREAEYEAAAKSIAEGGSGAIPATATYTANDQPRDGSNLFKNHIAQLDEDLVLAGTGGKLKMLVQQGPGEKRGNAKTQDDTFDEISRARANKASQCLHQDFDIPFLAGKFPMQPALVEFCLVTEDEQNVTELCTNVATLKTAGKNVKTEWLSEQTGYEFEEDDAAPDPNAETASDDAPNVPGETAPIKNRESSDDWSATIHEMLMPILDSLDALRKIDDPAVQRTGAAALLKNMPHLETIILNNKALANKLLPELVEAFVSGLKPEIKNRRILNGDLPGHEFHGNQYAEAQGVAAVEKIIKTKADVMAAMPHPKLGNIDFRYGVPGDSANEFKGGHGFAKIVAKHGEDAARKIPTVIARGQLTAGTTRAVIEHEGQRVVLSNNWHGQPSNHWVLSGYEKEKGR
jgi:phage-Barnase-EndoU-ColicinE5/D-RelE like nuclease1